MPIALMWLPILISLLSVIYVGLTYHYTLNWNREQANNASYISPLNYKVEWKDTKDTASLNGAVYNDMSEVPITKLPNQKFTITAVTGGIKSVSALFYRDGECLAIRKIDNSDQIKHDKKEAEDIGYICEIISVYPQVLATMSDESKSYCTSLFLVIEGYNNDIHIKPTVFEFGADTSGALTGKREVRSYSDIETLYTENTEVVEIPDFDIEVLRDLKKIRKSLNLD